MKKNICMAILIGIGSINTAIAMSAANTDSMVQSIINDAIDENDKEIIDIYEQYKKQGDSLPRDTLISVQHKLGVPIANPNLIRDALLRRYSEIMRQIEKQKSYLSASMKHFLEQAAKLGVTEERISDILNEVSRKAQLDPGDKGAALVKMLEQATQEFAAASSDENMQKIVAHRDLLKRQSQIMNDIESARQGNDTDALKKAMEAFEQVKAEIAKFEASESDGSQVTTDSKQEKEICNAVDHLLRFVKTMKSIQSKIDALAEQQIKSFENWQYSDRWNFEMATSSIEIELKSFSDECDRLMNDKILISKLFPEGSVTPPPPPPPPAVVTITDLVKKKMRTKFFAYTKFISRFMCILQPAPASFTAPCITTLSKNCEDHYKKFSSYLQNIQADSTMNDEHKKVINDISVFFADFKKILDAVPDMQTQKQITTLNVSSLLQQKQSVLKLLHSIRKWSKDQTVRRILQEYGQKDCKFIEVAKYIESEIIATYRALLYMIGINRVVTSKKFLPKEVTAERDTMFDFIVQYQQLLAKREIMHQFHDEKNIVRTDALYKMLMYLIEGLLRTGNKQYMDHLMELLELINLNLQYWKEEADSERFTLLNQFASFAKRHSKNLDMIPHIVQQVRGQINQKYFNDASHTNYIDDIIDNLQKLDCVLSTIAVAEKQMEIAKSVNEISTLLERVLKVDSTKISDILLQKKTAIEMAIKNLPAYKTKIPDSIKPILKKIADAMRQNTDNIKKLSFKADDDRSKTFSNIVVVENMMNDLITQVSVENISDINIKQTHSLIEELIASLDLLEEQEHYQCSNIVNLSHDQQKCQYTLQGMRSPQQQDPNKKDTTWNEWMQSTNKTIHGNLVELENSLKKQTISSDDDFVWDIVYSWPYETKLLYDCYNKSTLGLSSIPLSAGSASAETPSQNSSECMYDLMYDDNKLQLSGPTSGPTIILSRIRDDISSLEDNIKQHILKLEKCIDMNKAMSFININILINTIKDSIATTKEVLTHFSNFSAIRYEDRKGMYIKLDDYLPKQNSAQKKAPPIPDTYRMLILDLMIKNIDNINNTPNLPLLSGWKSNKEIFTDTNVLNSINDVCQQLKKIADTLNQAQSKYISFNLDLSHALSDLHTVVTERYAKLTELYSKFTSSK